MRSNEAAILTTWKLRNIFFQEKALEFLAHCQKVIDKGGLSEDDSFNVLLLREELKVYTEGAKFQG